MCIRDRKKVEDSLKNLEGLKSDAAAYVKQLDGKLEALNGELEQLAGQIAAKESDIDLANQQLDEAKAVEHQQYDCLLYTSRCV